MRSRTAAMCLALALTTTVSTVALFAPQQAQAQDRRGGYDTFYRDLSNDGRWVQHPQHGWVWYPTRVRADWRPYTDGRWVWTDQYGWYWASNERFGWATYHYGRWGYDRDYGWIWVPGNEWAPAWVSFRNSDEAIGWAPLPPETLALSLVALLAGGGRYVELSDSYYQPRWTFVPTRYFSQPRVYSHAYAPRQNVTYIRQTTNVTNYITVNNVTVNRSIDPRRIEKATGRRIEPEHVNQVNTRQDPSKRSNGKGIDVYRPNVERDDKAAPPPAARAKASDRPVVKIEQDAISPEERARPARDNKNDGRDEKNNGRDDKGNGRDAKPDAKAPGKAGAAPDAKAPMPQTKPADRAMPQDRGNAPGKGDAAMPAKTPEPQTKPADRAMPQDRGNAPGKGDAAMPAKTPEPQTKPADRAMPQDRGNAPGKGDAAMPAKPPEQTKPAERANAPQQRGNAPGNAGPARGGPADTVGKPDNSAPARGAAERGGDRGKNDGKNDGGDCGKPGQAACR